MKREKERHIVIRSNEDIDVEVDDNAIDFTKDDVDTLLYNEV